MQKVFDDGSFAWWEEYEYDVFGRLALKVTPMGEIGYTHDAAGNVEGIATNRGTEAYYSYDSRNRLIRVEDRTGIPEGLEGRVTEYSYTGNGALDTVELPNGVTTHYGYDEVNRVQDITARLAGNSLAQFSYDLRPGGHREKLTERIGGAQIHGTARMTGWDYDDLYRLREESVSDGTGDGSGTAGVVAYTHSKVGNRGTRTAADGLETMLFDQISHTYNTNDRLTGLDDVSYGYDSEGNTTSVVVARIPTKTDSYDENNRLIKRVEMGGRTITLLYDADGNRVRKTVSGGGEPTVTTDYLVDTLNPTGYAQVLEELESIGGGLAPVKRYTYGLDRISQAREDGTTHYYGYDGLGSVRYLTGESGAITDRYYYDAFGILLETVGTGTDNQYLYAGEQWDEDLGLYYNRARYLDPTIGRFWTMDEFEGVNTTPASLHKYLYASADPVNGRDPSGYFTLREKIAVTSVMVTLAAVTVPNYLNLSRPLGASGSGYWDIFWDSGEVAVRYRRSGVVPNRIYYVQIVSTDQSGVNYLKEFSQWRYHLDVEPGHYEPFYPFQANIPNPPGIAPGNPIPPGEMRDFPGPDGPFEINQSFITVAFEEASPGRYRFLGATEFDAKTNRNGNQMTRGFGMGVQARELSPRYQRIINQRAGGNDFQY